MNSKQNIKINQVTENTLVIGIDIAKKTHYACMTDERGVQLKKSFPIKQSREGFELFYQLILDSMQLYNKTDVIVGVEPTGHYWLNLAYFLDDLGIPLVVCNPMHVNRSKELDDNLPTKTDAKDALVIAKLVKDGRYSHPRILRNVEAELRIGTSLRGNLVEEMTAIQNKIIRWLDRYFPEFTKVFPTFGKMALTALLKTPLPNDVKDLEVEDLVMLYREVEDMKSPHRPKIQKLIHFAQSSIGVTEGLVMARIEMATLVQRYCQIEKELNVLQDQLKELAQTIAEYQWLETVPGIGDTTITEILSEIGSFTHYQHPRQLIKLAGLTLRENSSGQHKGQKRISKRGRRHLRAVLFRVMIPLVRHNEAFRQLHEYYTTRAINPLRKKQSLVVLCGKLLKILHAICTKQLAFDANQMILTIPKLDRAA